MSRTTLTISRRTTRASRLLQGEVTGMPDNADVGWFYDAGDGSVKEETVATGLDLLKSELYAALAFYDGVEVHIQVQQVNYSALEIGLIRSYVACARRGSVSGGQQYRSDCG